MVLMFIYVLLGTSAPHLVSSASNHFDIVAHPNKGKQSTVPKNAFVNDELVHIPDQMTFNCNNMKPGYYADVQVNCQVFHYCKWDGTRSTFTCPKGFQFNQETETCDARGIKCGVSDSAVTEVPLQETRTDQIPATSPPTTTTDRTQAPVAERRIRRQTVWIQDPRQIQHQLAASNLFVPQHFVPSPVAAASSSSSSTIGNNGNGQVFHLLIPSPQQQQQQPVFQVVSDVDPFLTLSTATQSQRLAGLANLAAASTATNSPVSSSVTTRQGQISRSSRPSVVLHSEHPTEHFFNTGGPQPLSPPGVGFVPRRQEHFSPQFFIEDTQDASDAPDAVFSEAPQQNFVARGQGSRRDNFFPGGRPPPFSDDNDFRQPFHGFMQDPPSDRRPGPRPGPGHHENQEPPTNFVINPEDLTLINEIRFPGPPDDNRQTTTQDTDGGRGSSVDRRPIFQQRPSSSSPPSNPRRPSSPPAPSQQGFLSHDQHLARFPQRFPAESPGNFDFAPQHRQPPLTPFQHPPPFFSQQFPPPTSFGDFPVQQQASRPAQGQHLNGRPHQQQPLNVGFTPPSVSEINRPVIGNIPRDQQDARPLHLGSPRPMSPPSPPPSAPTTGRGQTRLRPQSTVVESNSNSRRQPNRVNSLATSSAPPKKPAFSNVDSASPTDATEEFGIPPPTESFGIKLGHDEFVHSTSTPTRVRPQSRPVGSVPTSRPPSRPVESVQTARPQSPPPSQFFSAAPPSPFSTPQQPDRFFTPTPPIQQTSSHQRPSDNHFRDTSTPLSNDVRTHSNRPTGSSDVFGSSAENEDPNGRQNFNGFFQTPPPTPSSSEANFDNGGQNDQQFRRPFHGQLDETSSVENLDDTDGQRGNLQIRPGFPNFAPFHNRPPPQEDNRFSNFEGPFEGNRGFFSGPTFGPQSVDQLAPPDIPPFTTRPNAVGSSESTQGTITSQQDDGKHTDSTENESQDGPRSTAETTGIAEPTTSDPATVTPNGKRSRVPVGVTTPGRKGLRTRPPRVKSKTTTSQPLSSSTVSHRRRGRPTSTTSSPDASLSASTTRRRKPFFRRKTTTSTVAPTVSDLNDIVSSSESVSTSSSTSRKRRPTARRFNKDNSTSLRRRRPISTPRTTSVPSSTSSTVSLKSSSSSTVEDSFPASVSHHSSGISRDQLVTSKEHGHKRIVTPKSKADAMNVGSLEGLESKEQPIVTKSDGAEVASLEAAVHEHSALETTSSTTTSEDTSTKLTTASVTKGTQKPTTTTTTTAIPTTVEAVTDNITTSTSTTEQPVTMADGKPEAMAKLRSLLSRKFIIKQTTEKPDSK